MCMDRFWPFRIISDQPLPRALDGAKGGVVGGKLLITGGETGGRPAGKEVTL